MPDVPAAKPERLSTAGSSNFNAKWKLELRRQGCLKQVDGYGL